MKVLIVYDSYFDNTKKIAKAIGEALSGEDVKISQVNAVSKDDLKGLGLLIVGSPTRQFSATPRIKKFLAGLPAAELAGVAAAAFDTRADVKEVNNKVLNTLVRIFGFAAEPVAKKLRGKGAVILGEPEGFIVEASEGPLKEGEAARASAWIREIRAKI